MFPSLTVSPASISAARVPFCSFTPGSLLFPASCTRRSGEARQHHHRIVASRSYATPCSLSHLLLSRGAHLYTAAGVPGVRRRVLAAHLLPARHSQRQREQHQTLRHRPSHQITYNSCRVTAAAAGAGSGAWSSGRQRVDGSAGAEGWDCRRELQQRRDGRGWLYCGCCNRAGAVQAAAVAAAAWRSADTHSIGVLAHLRGLCAE